MYTYRVLVYEPPTILSSSLVVIDVGDLTIINGQVVDDEPRVFVIREETRDSELPKLLLGQQADDVGDVVAPESSEIGKKIVKIVFSLLFLFFKIRCSIVFIYEGRSGSFTN